eukprot:484978-Pyramimonas_sp.AAC.1
MCLLVWAWHGGCTVPTAALSHRRLSRPFEAFAPCVGAGDGGSLIAPPSWLRPHLEGSPWVHGLGWRGGPTPGAAQGPSRRPPTRVRYTWGLLDGRPGVA